MVGKTKDEEGEEIVWSVSVTTGWEEGEEAVLQQIAMRPPNRTENIPDNRVIVKWLYPSKLAASAMASLMEKALPSAEINIEVEHE